jgi:hypothetical protein
MALLSFARSNVCPTTFNSMFLNHGAKDKPVVRALAARLGRKGVEI